MSSKKGAPSSSFSRTVSFDYEKEVHAASHSYVHELGRDLLRIRFADDKESKQKKAQIQRRRNQAAKLLERKVVVIEADDGGLSVSLDQEWDTTSWSKEQIEAACEVLLLIFHTADPSESTPDRKHLALAMLNKLIYRHAVAETFMRLKIGTIVGTGISKLIKQGRSKGYLDLIYVLHSVRHRYFKQLSEAMFTGVFFDMMLAECKLAAIIIQHTFRSQKKLKQGIEQKGVASKFGTDGDVMRLRRNYLNGRSFELKFNWKLMHRQLPGWAKALHPGNRGPAHVPQEIVTMGLTTVLDLVSEKAGDSAAGNIEDLLDSKAVILISSFMSCHDGPFAAISAKIMKYVCTSPRSLPITIEAGMLKGVSGLLRYCRVSESTSTVLSANPSPKAASSESTSKVSPPKELSVETARKADKGRQELLMDCMAIIRELSLHSARMYVKRWDLSKPGGMTVTSDTAEAQRVKSRAATPSVSASPTRATTPSTPSRRANLEAASGTRKSDTAAHAYSTKEPPSKTQDMHALLLEQKVTEGNIGRLTEKVLGSDMLLNELVHLLMSNTSTLIMRTTLRTLIALSCGHAYNALMVRLAAYAGKALLRLLDLVEEEPQRIPEEDEMPEPPDNSIKNRFKKKEKTKPPPKPPTDVSTLSLCLLLQLATQKCGRDTILRSGFIEGLAGLFKANDKPLKLPIDTFDPEEKQISHSEINKEYNRRVYMRAVLIAASLCRQGDWIPYDPLTVAESLLEDADIRRAVQCDMIHTIKNTHERPTHVLLAMKKYQAKQGRNKKGPDAEETVIDCAALMPYSLMELVVLPEHERSVLDISIVAEEVGPLHLTDFLTHPKDSQYIVTIPWEEIVASCQIVAAITSKVGTAVSSFSAGTVYFLAQYLFLAKHTFIGQSLPNYKINVILHGVSAASTALNNLSLACVGHELSAHELITGFKRSNMIDSAVFFTNSLIAKPNGDVIDSQTLQALREVGAGVLKAFDGYAELLLSLHTAYSESCLLELKEAGHATSSVIKKLNSVYEGSNKLPEILDQLCSILSKLTMPKKAAGYAVNDWDTIGALRTHLPAAHTTVYGIESKAYRDGLGRMSAHFFNLCANLCITEQGSNSMIADGFLRRALEKLCLLFPYIDDLNSAASYCKELHMRDVAMVSDIMSVNSNTSADDKSLATVASGQGQALRNGFSNKDKRAARVAVKVRQQFRNEVAACLNLLSKAANYSNPMYGHSNDMICLPTYGVIEKCYSLVARYSHSHTGGVALGQGLRHPHIPDQLEVFEHSKHVKSQQRLHVRAIAVLAALSKDISRVQTIYESFDMVTLLKRQLLMYEEHEDETVANLLFTVTNLASGLRTEYLTKRLGELWEPMARISRTRATLADGVRDANWAIARYGISVAGNPALHVSTEGDYGDKISRPSTLVAGKSIPAALSPLSKIGNKDLLSTAADEFLFYEDSAASSQSKAYKTDNVAQRWNDGVPPAPVEYDVMDPRAYTQAFQNETRGRGRNKKAANSRGSTRGSARSSSRGSVSSTHSGNSGSRSPAPRGSMLSRGSELSQERGQSSREPSRSNSPIRNIPSIADGPLTGTYTACGISTCGSLILPAHRCHGAYSNDKEIDMHKKMVTTPMMEKTESGKRFIASSIQNPPKSVENKVEKLRRRQMEGDQLAREREFEYEVVSRSGADHPAGLANSKMATLLSFSGRNLRTEQVAASRGHTAMYTYFDTPASKGYDLERVDIGFTGAMHSPGNNSMHIKQSSSPSHAGGGAGVGGGANHDASFDMTSSPTRSTSIQSNLPPLTSETRRKGLNSSHGSMTPNRMMLMKTPGTPTEKFAPFGDTIIRPISTEESRVGTATYNSLALKKQNSFGRSGRHLSSSRSSSRGRDRAREIPLPTPVVVTVDEIPELLKTKPRRPAASNLVSGTKEP